MCESRGSSLQGWLSRSENMTGPSTEHHLQSTKLGHEVCPPHRFQLALVLGDIATQFKNDQNPARLENLRSLDDGFLARHFVGVVDGQARPDQSHTFILKWHNTVGRSQDPLIIIQTAVS